MIGDGDAPGTILAEHWFFFLHLFRAEWPSESSQAVGSKPRYGGDVAQSQPDQLGPGIIAGEVALRLDDLVVKSVQASLVFANELRLERAFSLPRHLNAQGLMVGEYRLGAASMEPFWRRAHQGLIRSGSDRSSASKTLFFAGLDSSVRRAALEFHGNLCQFHYPCCCIIQGYLAFKAGMGIHSCARGIPEFFSCASINKSLACLCAA